MKAISASRTACIGLSDLEGSPAPLAPPRRDLPPQAIGPRDPKGPRGQGLPWSRLCRRPAPSPIFPLLKAEPLSAVGVS
jgi:hypothetical protein